MPKTPYLAIFERSKHGGILYISADKTHYVSSSVNDESYGGYTSMGMLPIHDGTYWKVAVTLFRGRSHMQVTVIKDGEMVGFLSLFYDPEKQRANVSNARNIEVKIIEEEGINGRSEDGCIRRGDL